MCDRPLMTVTGAIRTANSTETSWHCDNKVSTAGDHLARVCVCVWRCIVALWRHVAFLESGWGDGVIYECAYYVARVASWERTLERLSHLLYHWTSPCSHAHLQTHTYMRTHSLGTHSGHLAQPVRILLRSVWPVDPPAATGVRQASASHHVIVATPPLEVCCLTDNLQICAEERRIAVV